MKQMKSVLFAAAVITASAVQAKLVPAPLFGDRCVLQRDRRVPVWGSADPGASVSVSFAGQTKTAKAGPNGAWRVDLDPLAASCEPREMRISAKGTQTEEAVLKDVVVGVVWLCGGQSNMTMQMWPAPAVYPAAGREINGYYDVMLTDEPLVRGVRMPCRWNVEETGYGKPLPWFAFTPASVRELREFSAAAWHYAMRLHQALKIPVGVIESGWGGSCIETWISSEGYAASGHFKDLATLPIHTEPTADEIERAKKRGREPSIHNQPRACWNAMMAPLAPYGIEGAIWYQGCGNRGRWEQYYEMLTALRTSWSLRFETPDLPFFLCQITPYGYGYGGEEKDPGITRIREEMERFGRTNGDRVGCAILSDIGEIDCIHPGDKRTVGTRLAALALNRIYGRKDLKCDAPVFRKAVLSADGRRVTLSFDHVEGWCRKGTYAPRFELAGTNGVYQAVESVVVKDVRTIDLKVPEGLQPVSVAYMRRSCVHGFVKNEAGLPLGPFRGAVEVEKGVK